MWFVVFPNGREEVFAEKQEAKVAAKLDGGKVEGRYLSRDEREELDWSMGWRTHRD